MNLSNRPLGYDPFDPTEVVPEYSTALGDYKGSRVDYATNKLFS